ADVDGASTVPEHGARDRANDGFGDDVGRIRESVREVAAFEIRTERLDGLAVRRGLRRGDGLECARLRLALEAYHRPQRLLGMFRLHLVSRSRRVRLQVQHWDAVNDREDAAVAAENPVADLVAAAAVKQRLDQLQRSAAVRTSEDLEQFQVHIEKFEV